MITVTPTLTVADVTVARSLAGAPPLVAVDALRVTWGRGTVLENPTPATAALTVLDRTAGATFARRTDLIGQPIVLGWSGSDGSTGVNFRGRVTDVQVLPEPGAVAGGGFQVALAASSIEVDLGNHTVPEGTAAWAAEQVGNRRDRLAAMLPAGRFTGGIVLPTRFDLGLQNASTPPDDPAVWPVSTFDPAGKSLLELVRGLFSSLSPLPMVYDPAADRLTFAGRRRFTYGPVGFTQSARLVADPDRAGRYVPAGLSGLHLDGDALAYSGPSGQSIDSRLSWVQVNYLDSGTGKTTTAEQGTPQWFTEDTLGRRQLAVESILGTSDRAQQAAAAYADLATREGMVPRLGSLGYSTAREPFPDAAHAGLLLAGCESGAVAFVGRTWLPQLGQRPLIGVLGATITYAAGEWSVDLTPAPVVIDPAPFGWAPITIAALATPAVTLAQLDPSLTLGDLGFLDVGAGFTAATALPYHGNPS